jgi:hypothetical protein
MLKKLMRRQQHTRCTKTALQCISGVKGLLKELQCAVCRKAFYRLHLGAVGLHSKNKATANDHTVQPYGTCAAHAVFAAYMCPVQSELLP